MSNILDYLDWRGDVSFRMDPYNEVDELVLCRLSYLPFEDVVPEELSRRGVLLPDAVKTVRSLLGENGDGRFLLLPDDAGLIDRLAVSRRFADVRLTGYLNQRDLRREKQFSATTMLLPDRTVLVAFRGTDGTLVGWKEDFNMSFSDTVPAQLDAAAYLERAGSKFPHAQLRVCGHSKGGNLAVFASAFCSPRLQRRILGVRNNDGPGFNDAVLKSEEYRRMVPRIHTYLPQSSVFGMLLEHAEQYSVVQSTNSGLAQHNLYSWCVTKNSCVYLEALSGKSHFVDAALKDWVTSLTPEQREQVVDKTFEILRDAGVHNVEELMSGRKNMAIMKTLMHRDEGTRKLLFGALRILRDAVKRSLPLMKEKETNRSDTASALS